MKTLINLIILSGIFVLIFSCSDEPVKPDPCSGKHPVTAEFKMYEQLKYDTLYTTDTSLQYNFVHFKAVGDYDKYEWQIGLDDSVFTHKEVKLRFNEAYGPINIRLIVKGKPDTTCFPDDDGIDTVNKTLTVVSWHPGLSTNHVGSALVGRYKGATIGNPLDTFIVEIKHDTAYDNGEIISRHYYINNMPKGCKGIGPYDHSTPRGSITMGYRALRFALCNSVGYVFLDEKHEFIEIQYSTLLSSFEIANKIYKGKKL